MNFQQAVNMLRGAIPAGDDQIDAARTAIVRDVCDALGITWRSDEAANLGDWLAAGDWSGSETAESVAADWRREW